MQILKIFVSVVFCLAAVTSISTRSIAQQQRWDGNSPFCNGSCRADETEITRAATSPGSPPAYNGPIFGAAAAQEVFRLSSKPQDQPILHLLSYIIAGHHAGLPDYTNELDDRLKKRVPILSPGWREEISSMPKAYGRVHLPRIQINPGVRFKLPFLAACSFHV